MNQEGQVVTQEQWMQAQTTKTISTDEVDQLVMRVKLTKDIYEAAKAKSNDLEKEYREAKRQVIDAFTTIGKKKYYVDGVGTCYFIEKLVVKTPKTLEDKQKFFDFLKEKHGETFLLDKQGVNHQSLQKIYNDLYDEAVENGCGDTFNVPGLEAPTSDITLGFRKEK